MKSLAAVGDVWLASAGGRGLTGVTIGTVRPDSVYDSLVSATSPEP